MERTNGKTEGWLYLVSYNRFGLHNIRKRYFVLHQNCLKSFKSIPTSGYEVPIASAFIDSCLRVTDNGMENIHKKVFFFFTLSNTSNHNEQLKLGASSPEEAARWIRALQDAMSKEFPSTAGKVVDHSATKWRLGHRRTILSGNYTDWIHCSVASVDAMTSDVIAPSPWKLIGCRNGLRLFKESKNGSHKRWDDHPAIMAVGVVNGPSEGVFQTLMSLGPSRSEWDFCFNRGSVIEHLDGHTDIIHKQLYQDWLPWGVKQRDLLLRRYWRREDDGTYVILYHSVIHKKCPRQKGYIRACLKSGGYVICPLNHGKHSVVRHMLAIDWKCWRSYLRLSSGRSITINMLERVAALRELFQTKGEDCSSHSHKPQAIQMTHQHEMLHNETKLQSPTTQLVKENNNGIKEDAGRPSVASSLMDLNDASDEFFDVDPEPASYEDFESHWSEHNVEQPQSPSLYQSKLSATGIVKKWQDLTVQKKSFKESPDMCRSGELSTSYGATLQKDPTASMACSYAAADPSSFLIRGETYLRNQQKVKAKNTKLQIVGADWLKSDKLEGHLASRHGSIVQKYAAQGGSEFFVVVNIQVPGATTYNLALYYMTKTPLQDNPLLDKFVHGDDAYRNARFKLIPYISKGSWIVKQSVGKKACLIGQALEVHYFRGNNYLELDIDVGSSTVARGVVNLVLGYLNNLVIEMAFLIQANTDEELPENLLGTCRINHLDVSKAVIVRA